MNIQSSINKKHAEKTEKTEVFKSCDGMITPLNFIPKFRQLSCIWQVFWLILIFDCLPGINQHKLLNATPVA